VGARAEDTGGAAAVILSRHAPNAFSRAVHVGQMKHRVHRGAGSVVMHVLDVVRRDRRRNLARGAPQPRKRFDLLAEDARAPRGHEHAGIRLKVLGRLTATKGGGRQNDTKIP
jgi:hypothetical protein